VRTRAVLSATYPTEIGAGSRMRRVIGHHLTQITGRLTHWGGPPGTEAYLPDQRAAVTECTWKATFGIGQSRYSSFTFHNVVRNIRTSR